MNDRDAEEIGVADNDWVEAYNDHGVTVTRAIVSAASRVGCASSTIRRSEPSAYPSRRSAATGGPAPTTAQRAPGSSRC